MAQVEAPQPKAPAVAAAQRAAKRGLSPALHPSLYLDEDVLAQEWERIFDRSWQLAGHISDLPEVPGGYLATRAGNQPVLLVRDDEGELRAFLNVCRHRGSRLLAGSGQCKRAIRCLYHGWTYRFDGSLVGTPEARAFTDLDKSTLGLFPARVELLSGLIFVNADPEAQPLAERVPGLAEKLAPYGIERLESFSRGAGMRQAANWKVVVDNYIEGYHIPIAHPGLMRLLDYQSYEPVIEGDCIWIEAPMRDKPSANRRERTYQRMVKPMPGLGEEHQHVWRYAFIYPNTAIDLYPDQINTWQLLPDGVGRTEDVWNQLRAPNAGPRTRVVQKLNTVVNNLVFKEDVDLVENVQAGLAVRGYECGPLNGREEAVAWFADRVRADLGLEAHRAAGPNVARA